jgi:hypothetical protein
VGLSKDQDSSVFEANERDAYFGEIFVFTDVLYGTYIATPGVHSPGYRGLNPGISGLARHTDRYISSLLLAAAIAAPTAIMADPRPQGAGVRF